jgi:hypothetical protein
MAESEALLIPRSTTSRCSSAREKRERGQAVRLEQFAGDRLDLRHLFREENAADDLAVVCREDVEALLEESPAQEQDRPQPEVEAAGDLRVRSSPRRRATRSSPAALRRAALCSGPPASAAPAPPPRSARSGRGYSPSRPTRPPDAARELGQPDRDLTSRSCSARCSSPERLRRRRRGRPHAELLRKTLERDRRALRVGLHPRRPRLADRGLTAH